jgi:hypothetical protein
MIKIRLFIFLFIFNNFANAIDYQVLNSEYKGQILPLIKDNCLSCHGGVKLQPWYRELPGVKQYINGHINDAKTSLNMEQGIPFKGKGIQSDIFWSIISSIKNDRMPPKSFSLLHQDIKFDDKDREVIIKWFTEKREELLANDL